MNNVDKIIAKDLLKIGAVKLSPEKPFIWASGINSPIYCDNRKILSYPKIRASVCDYMIAIIKENFKDVEYIAGVATGAIAWGVLVAEKLGIPFVYIRPKPKDHGMGNQIEGEIHEGAKAVVIEDLISTGKSSLSAVATLNKAGVITLGMVAIFSYNFINARRAFEYANVLLFTLSNYDTLIDEAVASDYIKEKDIDVLKQWRITPETWRKKE